MAKPQAEIQREFRKRRKARAAAGDKHAQAAIKRDKEAQKIRNYRSHAKTFLTKYATQAELEKFQKIIKERLE